MVFGYTSSFRMGQIIRFHLKNFCEKFVNNHVFRTYLDNPVYRNGAVKYILSEYSKDNFNLSSYKDFQVEHVFSKEPNYDTLSYGFAEDYDYEKNRFGNLGLLEKGLNIGLGNLPPINKVNGYLESKNTEMRNLAGKIQKGSFNKTNVDNRREDILEFCLKRFTLN